MILVSIKSMVYCISRATPVKLQGDTNPDLALDISKYKFLFLHCKSYVYQFGHCTSYLILTCKNPSQPSLPQPQTLIF